MRQQSVSVYQGKDECLNVTTLESVHQLPKSALQENTVPVVQRSTAAVQTPDAEAAAFERRFCPHGSRFSNNPPVGPTTRGLLPSLIYHTAITGPTHHSG